MPAAKKMIEKYKDRDVVFLFFCLNSEKYDWIESIEEFDTGGNHYFFSTEESG